MNAPATELLSGMGVSEGDRYSAGMFHERRQSETCIVARTFDLGEPLSATATGVNRYGELIFWEERTIPIMENGKVARVMHVLRDITELREVEAELRMLSVKDTLTDLYNRRHFCEVLEREMHRAQRQRSALCLMLLDVDGFKEYNDQHGHVAGDEILIQLGEMLKDCIREHVDSACRLGGDEFTVVLPQTSIEQATHVAQRLREKFQPLKEKGLTLSIGVASYNDETRVEDFVNRADKAMYDVKHFGKDAIKVV
ncbi:MAG: diguanylate cyclase [Candidatus Hydrogenedentes bacterium]|nr:diguanylate cyclase [Candidatus Hydrogenedentota bacterium]